SDRDEVAWDEVVVVVVELVVASGAGPEPPTAAITPTVPAPLARAATQMPVAVLEEINRRSLDGSSMGGTSCAIWGTARLNQLERPGSARYPIRSALGDPVGSSRAQDIQRRRWGW